MYIPEGEDISCYDVNGLYPTVMKLNKYPPRPQASPPAGMLGCWPGWGAGMRNGGLLRFFSFRYEYRCNHS